MTPETCESCDQPIWNPEFWGVVGMCGPCTTGEAATLFHELWILCLLDDVDTDEKMLEHWRQWYKNIYQPATKS